MCVCERERGDEGFATEIFPTGLFTHQHVMLMSETCAVCGRDTLHSELDEASTLSIGVDGMAGEEDRISSLGWVQL